MAKLKFRPLHDRVVIQSASKPRKRPKAASYSRYGKEKPRRARSSPSARAPVRENGKLIILDVEAGDRVLFGKWSGTEIKLDGDELLI